MSDSAQQSISLRRYLVIRFDRQIEYVLAIEDRFLYFSQIRFPEGILKRCFRCPLASHHQPRSDGLVRFRAASGRTAWPMLVPFISLPTGGRRPECNVTSYRGHPSPNGASTRQRNRQATPASIVRAAAACHAFPTTASRCGSRVAFSVPPASLRQVILDE